MLYVGLYEKGSSSPTSTQSHYSQSTDNIVDADEVVTGDSMVLQEILMPVISTEECNARVTYDIPFTDQMVCAYNEENPAGDICSVRRT